MKNLRNLILTVICVMSFMALTGCSNPMNVGYSDDYSRVAITSRVEFKFGSSIEWQKTIYLKQSDLDSGSGARAAAPGMHYFLMYDDAECTIPCTDKNGVTLQNPSCFISNDLSAGEISFNLDNKNIKFDLSIGRGQNVYTFDAAQEIPNPDFLYFNGIEYKYSGRE